MERRGVQSKSMTVPTAPEALASVTMDEEPRIPPSVSAKASDSSIPCLQKTRSMRRDKP